MSANRDDMFGQLEAHLDMLLHLLVFDAWCDTMRSPVGAMVRYKLKASADADEAHLGVLLDACNEALPADADGWMRLLISAVHDLRPGVLACDMTLPGAPILFVNKGFERITGYTNDEVVGRKCRFLQGEKSDATMVDAIRRAMQTASEVHVRLLNYRKDGSAFLNMLSRADRRRERRLPLHDRHHRRGDRLVLADEAEAHAGRSFPQAAADAPRARVARRRRRPRRRRARDRPPPAAPDRPRAAARRRGGASADRDTSPTHARGRAVSIAGQPGRSGRRPSIDAAATRAGGRRSGSIPPAGTEQPPAPARARRRGSRDGAATTDGNSSSSPAPSFNAKPRAARAAAPSSAPNSVPQPPTARASPPRAHATAAPAAESPMSARSATGSPSPPRAAAAVGRPADGGVDLSVRLTAAVGADRAAAGADARVGVAPGPADGAARWRLCSRSSRARRWAATAAAPRPPSSSSRFCRRPARSRSSRTPRLAARRAAAPLADSGSSSDSPASVMRRDEAESRRRLEGPRERDERETREREMRARDRRRTRAGRGAADRGRRRRRPRLRRRRPPPQRPRRARDGVLPPAAAPAYVAPPPPPPPQAYGGPPPGRASARRRSTKARRPRATRGRRRQAMGHCLNTGIGPPPPSYGPPPGYGAPPPERPAAGLRLRRAAAGWTAAASAGRQSARRAASRFPFREIVPRVCRA